VNTRCSESLIPRDAATCEALEVLRDILGEVVILEEAV